MALDGINNYNKNNSGGKGVDGKEPLDDMSILATISQAVNDADDWNTNNLSSQRVDAYNMYYGSFPKQRTRGRSQYVSLDVLDSVESLKASLLNVFGSERNVITFEPYTSQDTIEVEQANRAMDYIFHNQNSQHDIHNSVMFDGLLTKIGVVKCYHEQVERCVDLPFSGTRDQLDILLGQNEDLELKEERDVQDVDVIEVDEYGDPMAGTTEFVEATLTQTYIEDKICVDVIPPEEFLVDERARCVEDAIFTCHQRDVTIGELREMGFPEDKIEEVGSGDVDGRLSVDYERVARNQYDNKGSFSTSVPVADESMAYVTLYESYLVADYDGDGYPTMCQVFSVDNVLLEKTKVECNPFHAFVPFPISHKLHGQSIADRVGGVQVYKTQLERAILDNTELNNNTRFIANIGMLENPRELTDTRFGGIVRAKGAPQQAVQELTKPTLSPHTFQALQMLDDEKDQRTGVNKLSRGLSEDAIKPGNAASKVSEAVSLSMLRQKEVARQYASFWKKVYEHVYTLAVAYMPYLDVPNPEGEAVVLRPTNWKSSRTATVNSALAFGEADRKAQQLIQIDQVLANDQAAQAMYSQEDKFRLWTEVFDSLGYSAPYVSPPDPNKMTAAQQQALQLQQQQLMAAQQSNALQQQALQLQQVDRQLAAKRVGIEQQKADTDAMVKQEGAALAMDKFDLDVRKTADSHDIDLGNLQLDVNYKADLIKIQQQQTVLDAQKLELERQQTAIEAALEAEQERGVDIG